MNNEQTVIFAFSGRSVLRYASHTHHCACEKPAYLIRSAFPTQAHSIRIRASIRSFFRNGPTLEEDFFLRTADQLIPVEVKARSGRAKSLRTLIDSDRYPDIRCGIKFTGGDIGCSEGIYAFPYFCVFLIKRYLQTGHV